MPFYKRTVFLVNPAFQLKFSFIVCSIVVVSNLIYPFLLVDFFDEIISTVPNLPASLIASRSDFIFYLMIIQIVLTLLVFITFIFMTHKIAGPFYKLKAHLGEIREGEAITPIAFRKGDYFTDVAEEVSLFLETVSQNQEDDFQYLDEVSVYLENLSTVIPDDKKPVLNEICRRLLQIKDRYKKSL